jgi:hypothetical protein
MPSLRAPLAFVLTMRSIQDEHDSRHVRIAEALDLVVACFLLNRIFAAAMMCAVNSPSRSCRTSFPLPHRIESKVRQWCPTRRKVQKTGQRLRHTSGSFSKARPKCLSRKMEGYLGQTEMPWSAVLGSARIALIWTSPDRDLYEQPPHQSQTSTLASALRVAPLHFGPSNPGSDAEAVSVWRRSRLEFSHRSAFS